jgi:hypothetical protein
MPKDVSKRTLLVAKWQWTDDNGATWDIPVRMTTRSTTLRRAAQAP